MQFREESEGGGKNFLKLKPGQSVRGVLRGDLYEFRQHWINNKGVACPGEGCAICAKGEKNSFRFRLNFVMRETEGGPFVAKIFEQGWMVYAQLRELHKDYPLPETVIKITRNGEGTNTTYVITPTKDALTGALAASVKSVPLLDLSHSQAADSGSHAGEYDAMSEAVPF